MEVLLKINDGGSNEENTREQGMKIRDLVGQTKKIIGFYFELFKCLLHATCKNGQIA